MSYQIHLEDQWEERIYGDELVNLKQKLIEIPLSAPSITREKVEVSR